MTDVGCRALDAHEDHERLERWVRSPHVARWWGTPDLHWTMLRQRSEDTHLIITADGTPVGYLCWQRPSREELADAGLSDLPGDLVDIDLLIGEVEYLGCGVGSRALTSLLGKLRGAGVGFAGLARSASNRAAIRAYEKAGFRAFREFKDAEAGPSTYLLAEPGGAVEPPRDPEPERGEHDG